MYASATLLRNERYTAKSVLKAPHAVFSNDEIQPCGFTQV